MHSSLVITWDGLPLGLAAIKFRNRDRFHGANALKRSINPARVPIEKKESIRWLETVGGYLARAHDPPPGNTVIWRGITRLTDIELGIMIGVLLVGN
jgi:hypothetical protein